MCVRCGKLRFFLGLIRYRYLRCVIGMCLDGRGTVTYAVLGLLILCSPQGGAVTKYSPSPKDGSVPVAGERGGLSGVIRLLSVLTGARVAAAHRGKRKPGAQVRPRPCVICISRPSARVDLGSRDTGDQDRFAVESVLQVEIYPPVMNVSKYSRVNYVFSVQPLCSQARYSK